VKIQGQNEEMLQAACQQFLGKSEEEIRKIARETLEGHQRAIMGNMTVEVCYQFHLLILTNWCTNSMYFVHYVV
jgi:flotillin